MVRAEVWRERRCGERKRASRHAEVGHPFARRCAIHSWSVDVRLNAVGLGIVKTWRGGGGGG